jgi:hypothetical protein
MAWSYIRVAIFTAAFLVGLHVFGSSSSPTTGSPDSEKDPFRAAGESIEIHCVDHQFTLVDGKGGPVSDTQFTGM